MRVLTIDIETTGLPPKGATYEADFMSYPYVVTVAWKVDDDETQEYIINQEGREIPKEASDLHGITTEIANASPHKFEDVFAGLLALEMPELVVGHNIYFDTSIIKANVLRCVQNETMMQDQFDKLCELLHKDRRVDTMKSTTKFCHLPGPYGAKWPKLTELYSKLFGEEYDAHCAKNDVDATYKCFLRLKELGVL